MSEKIEKTQECVETLRSRMDADARFHRVISGYDPGEVSAYLEDVRHVYAKQAKAFKQEQESLITQLESARSELLARNCAIKSLKETLAHREELLGTANTRVGTLIESVKRLEAERQGLEGMREANEKARAAEARAESAEQEALQLRDTLMKAAKLIENWKGERATFSEDNKRLQQENAYLKDLFKTLIPAQGAVAMQQAEAGRQPEQRPERNADALESDQAVSIQLADALADAFADAYELVSKLRKTGLPKRSVPVRAAQPHMQVLRPNGTASSVYLNEK